MKLVEINWHPTHRQLRQFGAICIVALPVVGWFWGGGTTIVILLAAIGLALALAGLAVPQSLKPIFLFLMIVATPIGMVIGELAMLMIYFGVFLPIGLAFRIAKRDALQRTLDQQKTTYWQPKKQPANVASYYRRS